MRHIKLLVFWVLLITLVTTSSFVVDFHTDALWQGDWVNVIRLDRSAIKASLGMADHPTLLESLAHHHSAKRLEFDS